MPAKKMSELELDQSVERRFLAGVLVLGPDECWEWQGARTQGGYGVLGRGRKAIVYTHRLALQLSGSPSPEGRWAACHRCDNPPCCNPGHLFWGTDADNMTDSVSKGRRHKSECKRGHPRNEENTRVYLDSRGRWVRDCRVCDRLRAPRRRGAK